MIATSLLIWLGFTREQPTRFSARAVVLVPLALFIPGASSAQFARDPSIPPPRTSTYSAPTHPVASGLSDGPIVPGDIVHLEVFHAPDLSTVTRVSMEGDIACPLVGIFHVGGLSSREAGERYAALLKDRDLVRNPKVILTVDSTSTGITVLGEVRAPGIFPIAGRGLLSDVLASAGGLTGNTGRVIEISTTSAPDQKELVPWDPTMHNTSSFDRPLHPGDRIVVRACGVAYLGGRVAKPGAYSLCGSSRLFLSQLLASGGGILPLSSSRHTTIVRVAEDGSRMIVEVDAQKVLRAEVPDMEIREDDVIYVPPSAIKNATKAAMEFSMSLVAPLLYVYR